MSAEGFQQVFEDPQLGPIIVEDMFPSGGRLVTCVYNDQRWMQKYYDYTTEEAVEMFRNWVLNPSGDLP